MMKIKHAAVLMILLCFSVMPVYAGTQDTNMQEELDYAEVQKALDEMLPDKIDISFSELVSKMTRGDMEGIFNSLKDYLINMILYEVSYHRGIVIQIIGIVILSAVFTNFSMAFSKTYVAETGFYLTYMVLFTLLLTSFVTAVNITSALMGNILTFMSALVPVFCLAVTFTGSIQTGIWYQQMMVAVITLVEWIVSKGVLTLIHVYVLISLINQLSKEDMLSKCGELIKTASGWILKTVLGIILGVHFIQSMVLPAFETIKNGWAVRLTSAVPGVGDAMGAAMQTVIGSAVLIKNGVGAAGLILLVLLFAIPALKLGIIALMYMLVQAIVQPVADERMLKCIHAVTEGVLLLLKVSGTVFILFFLSMAMITLASSSVFGG